MPLKIPRHPPAPGRTDPRDKRWFAENPARRQRVRAPFAEELARVRLQGLLKPLRPGQEHAVIVSDLGTHIMTQLVTVRLDQPGVYPDNDQDIDRAFRRPNAPQGVPA